MPKADPTRWLDGKGWLQRFSNLGVTASTPLHTAKRVRVSNLFAFTCGLLTLGYAPLFAFALGVPLLGALTLLTSYACTLTPWLNARGHTLASRVSLVAVCNVSALAHSLTLGADSGLHLLFPALACATILLFEPRRRACFAVSLAAPVLGLTAALLHDRFLGALHPLPAGRLWLLALAMGVTSLLLLVSVVASFHRATHAAELEIRGAHRLQTEQLVEALRRSEERYALAARGAHDGLWEWRRHRGELYCSARFCEIVGLPPQDTVAGVQQIWAERIHPEDRRRVAREVRAHLTGFAERFRSEHRVLLADGRCRWVLSRGLAVRRDDGSITRMAGWITDITERKEAVERLRQSEERFRQLVRQAADAMFYFDAQGRVLDVNEQAERDLGYTRDELLALRVWDVDVQCQPDQLMEILRSLERTGHITVEREYRRKDGSFYPVELRLGLIMLDGQQQGLALARDVSKRRAMEAKLMFADRMASVGTLAAGVAHEINNPLTYLGMNLEFVCSHLEALTATQADPLAARLHTALERAQEGCERVATIVRDLKTFARGDDDRLETVQPAAVLDSTLGLAEGAIGRHAQLVRDVAPDLPSLRANEARLGQVFLNLLMNASQSFEGLPPRRTPRILVRARALGGQVIVEVSDNGKGIDAQDLARIFDPFFTTKPVGLGTGLGLFICQNIVRSYGGSIEADSRPGEGTCMRVYLPATVAPGRSQSAITRRPLNVLIIAPDPPSIGTLQQTFENHELHVVQRRREVLSALTDPGYHADFVFCDLEHTPVQGREVYETLQRVHAQARPPLIFMAAGALDHAGRRLLQTSGGCLLSKPLQTDQLRHLLDDEGEIHPAHTAE